MSSEHDTQLNSDGNYYPLVTIGSPCYNHEKYLDDYFQGVLNQTYPNIELVIVDDCSTDNSLRIIQDYIPTLKKHGINVLLIRHECNMGVTKSLNDLINQSCGDYIKLVATDDILTPDSVSFLINRMNLDNNINLLVGNNCVVENDYHYGDPIKNIRGMDIENLERIDNQHEKLFESCFINSPGAFFKKSLFDKYGLYDEKLTFEDWDFFLRVAAGERIYFLDEVVVLYRKSVTSASNYHLSIDDGEKKEKYIRMYIGTRDLFRKHKGEIADNKWKECFKRRYNIFLNEADSLGYSDYINIIFKDLKKDGLDDYSLRTKLAYKIKNKYPKIFKEIKKFI